MQALTGVLALFLIFLSGPYRTLQKSRRLTLTWGPVISVWAHSNISLAALTAVFLHIIPKLLKLKPSLIWISTGLFLVSFVSGIIGLYLATSPPARRRWLSVHRPLTIIFYLSLLPHVIGESLGWPLVLIALGVWYGWRYRMEMRERLQRLRFPFRKPRKRCYLPGAHEQERTCARGSTGSP